ncbi:MAG: hypothetical protein RR205_03080 [Oscillospiraceae bacterium]
MMNLIPCNKPCNHQCDGYCNLDGIHQLSNTTDSCPYYNASLTPQKPTSSDIPSSAI